MSQKNSNSAIVLIEYQNQWIKKGLYYSLIKKQLKSRKVLENTHSLVTYARTHGMKIIHAPLVIDPKNKKGWLAYLTFGQIFTKGTWKAAIPEELISENDLFVQGRYSFDAFVGSDLENLIRNNNFDKLYLCGFITNQCIAKTLKTCMIKKIEAYIVSDCTATISNYLQNKSENRNKHWVVNSTGICSNIAVDNC